MLEVWKTSTYQKNIATHRKRTKWRQELEKGR